MFWSDWDTKQPRIERSTMTGDDRKAIFNISSVTGGGWPNGLAVDYETDRLYWIDARLDKSFILCAWFMALMDFDHHDRQWCGPKLAKVYFKLLNTSK